MKRWRKRAFPDIDQDVFDNLQVHHAMPQATHSWWSHLGIYPEQMHSLENLRGIPKDAFHPNISGQKLHPYITGQWTQFKNQNPNALFDEVMDKIQEIDDEFGHLFIPPIR